MPSVCKSSGRWRGSSLWLCMEGRLPGGQLSGPGRLVGLGPRLEVSRVRGVQLVPLAPASPSCLFKRLISFLNNQTVTCLEALDKIKPNVENC